MPSKNNVSQLKSEANPKPPVLNPDQAPALKKRAKSKMDRVNKGFQIEVNRARQWDMLVAKMKGAGDNKKTGPELMDEALDYLFQKYGE